MERPANCYSAEEGELVVVLETGVYKYRSKALSVNM